MSVYIYTGGLKIVKKSGVGQAILHQQEALRAAHIKIDEQFTRETQIVHINTVFPDSPFVAVKAKLHGAKIVYYAHSTMEDFKNSFRGSNLFAPLFRKWILFCYNCGDIILTPTEYSKQLLKDYGIHKPIYSISNGIDTEKFCFRREYRAAFRKRYHLKECEPVVISVGHMIERKGILDYIALARKMPQVNFFWFGYTKPSLLPSEVKKAIKSAPKNVIFAGYVNQEQLRDAYCGADAFAFLSKEETEGIVVLEALACQTPTIVRNIPVYHGWLAQEKNIYKANTQTDFEKLISGILKKRLPNLTDSGRKVAEARSFPSIGKQLKDIYLSEGVLLQE